jgi:hypothetical protein
MNGEASHLLSRLNFPSSTSTGMVIVPSDRKSVRHQMNPSGNHVTSGSWNTTSITLIMRRRQRTTGNASTWLQSKTTIGVFLLLMQQQQQTGSRVRSFSVRVSLPPSFQNERLSSARSHNSNKRRKPYTLYMFDVIEDNNDKRPKRCKPDLTTESIHPSKDVLYLKKVESNFYNQYNNAVKIKDWKDEWGVEYHHRHHNHHTVNDWSPTTTERSKIDTTTSLIDQDITKYFPSTVDEVTDVIVSSINAVLLHDADTMNRDPNHMYNTVHGDNVLGRRPVRHAKYDTGRIGIELDWSSFADWRSNNEQNISDKQNYAAIRYASLVLARKLSQSRSYSLHEKSGQHMPRPIAVYFNTVPQALAASQQLSRLSRLESVRQQGTAAYENTHQVEDAIHIRCLCQGDTIPNELINHPKRQSHGDKSTSALCRSLSSGKVDPTTGLIIIVQPTNYNDEFDPHGPSIGVVESIQRLLASAAVEQLPVIMVSPRFMNAHQQAMTSLSGWDQSGNYQQSSLYAGIEPPKGPTPWILRDFTPPIFSYIANALSIDATSQQLYKENGPDVYSYCSHLSLWQSVLHKGHTWNLFAAVRHVPTTTDQNIAPSMSYRCIATSKNSAGRPTRQIMRRIWNEYSRFNVVELV